MFDKLLRKIKNRFYSSDQIDLVEFWYKRSEQYGAGSVLNVQHTKAEYDDVTRMQLELLMPLLKAQLNGTEKKVLDFGCGPGRFTRNLAELINGQSVGVDVTQSLLDIAPKTSSVTYVRIYASQPLPFNDASFDIVWCCLVLGGIHDSDIAHTLNEINRALTKNGLFFLIENTSKLKNVAHWFFRSEREYIKLAAFCNLKKLDFYDDLGQKITIFSGRKV